MKSDFSKYLIFMVLLVACGAESKPDSVNTIVIGDSNISEIIIGQWGPSTECDEGYSVLQIRLQPELQKQLESAFEFGSMGKITIYCGCIVDARNPEAKCPTTGAST